MESKGRGGIEKKKKEKHQSENENFYKKKEKRKGKTNESKFMLIRFSSEKRRL